MPGYPDPRADGDPRIHVAVKARALLAALVSFCGCASAPVGRQAGNAGTLPVGGIRFAYSAEVGRAGQGYRGRDQLLARAASVMQRRVDALFKRGAVRATATGIEVVLPDDIPAVLERYRRLAPRPGVFEIKLVDDGSAYMAALAEQSRHGVYDFEDDVLVVEDRWQDPAGGAHRDPYFTAPEREALVATLHRLTAVSPLPPDRQILIEAYGQSGPSYRSYLVASRGGVGNADIDAAAVAPGVDGQPEVVISLTAEGRRKFGDMTEAAIGRKIAIVIDGRIMSAPLIIEPIRNGRVHVRFGVYPSVDESAQRAEAEDLAALLRSGPLPARLSLEREERAAR